MWLKNFFNRKIFISYIIWRILLFTVAALAPVFIANYGGRFPYYELLISSGLPYWVWSFAGFDGVHYLTIAASGYSAQYTQAFFPLYPLFIKLITINHVSLIAALLVSNFCFLISVYLLYLLFKLDYDSKTAFKAILLLLCFPTAFYFAAIYSESLFLLLTVASLLAVRKKHYLWAGLFAGFATATRIIGVFLLAVLIIELYLDFKQRLIIKAKLIEALVGVVLAPLGLIAYMVYLKIQFDNPIYFLTAQPAFGAARSASAIISLPQVLFRYLKILTSVQLNTLPYFNAALEFIMTIVPLALLVFYFRKMRFSYWIFSLGCLILPTFTGTLSSMPRYSLMTFLIFPLVVMSLGRNFKFIALSLIILQVILLMMFSRGYWVA